MHDIGDFLISYTSDKWHSVVLAMFVIIMMICIWIFFPKKQVIYKADVAIDKLLNDYSDTLKDEITAQIGNELVIPIYRDNASSDNVNKNEKNAKNKCPRILTDSADVKNSAIKNAKDSADVKNNDPKILTDKFPTVVNFINDTGKHITYAGIIVLQPKFFQVKHVGYAPNANSTLRYYYPICHSSVDRSGLWIDGEKKSFYKGTTICADVSYESSLFNACERRKTVLLFFDVVTKKKGVSTNNIIEKDDILFQFHNAQPIADDKNQPKTDAPHKKDNQPHKKDPEKADTPHKKDNLPQPKTDAPHKKDATK